MLPVLTRSTYNIHAAPPSNCSRKRAPGFHVVVSSSTTNTRAMRKTIRAVHGSIQISRFGSGRVGKPRSDPVRDNLKAS